MESTQRKDSIKEKAKNDNASDWIPLCKVAEQFSSTRQHTEHKPTKN